MTAEPSQTRRSNAYHIFILALTLFSLVLMVDLLLPLSEQTLDLLLVYDNFDQQLVDLRAELVAPRQILETANRP